MYQHSVVSAAPACGVGVPIRSHVQALWSPGRAIATSPSLGREGSAVPWACSSARCWAPRGSTLFFVPHRSTESAPRAVVSAMANSTLGSPHHHLRKGECTAVCTHCKARHWECERSKSTRHFSACCSQGKVQPCSCLPLPSPISSIGSFFKARIAVSCSVQQQAVAFRENARSYNNALSFTSLAAHWDQTQVGTLGPPVFRVLCSNMADRPGRGHRHSTWTRRRRQSHATIYFDKLESILRTGNRFVREFASAKARAGWDTAKEWILRLCLRPGRDRRTHNLPTSSTEMAMLICDSDTKTGDRGLVSSLHPSAMPLRYPLPFPAGEDGFHPNIPLCGFHQARPPIARN
ncbi:BQ5605_C006g04008 [Microbotryum silenes-dioicae]|uniref:BQ5605_C006g04008 protein n=1 Tax=Microbotryum silenes-dioicae TaxID=796604 RepID=A0A2X0MSV3_9BASI|nr:BQ5605_C006g04008 [Microbotryum silenes-dioicae]